MHDYFTLSGNGTCSGHSCGDGVCIPTDYVCDDYLDCRDASDEANCTSTSFQNTFYPQQLPSRCPNSTSLIGMDQYGLNFSISSTCTCIHVLGICSAAQFIFLSCFEVCVHVLLFKWQILNGIVLKI